jgi:hypothetical protein
MRSSTQAFSTRKSPSCKSRSLPPRSPKRYGTFWKAAGARTALLAGAIGVVLVLLTMGSAVVEMVATWRGNEAYQYAWLVLPMLIYVLGWHWNLASQPVDVRPDLTGVAVVAVAAALWSPPH